MQTCPERAIGSGSSSRPAESSTLERLLDAAIGLSLEKGFADTTVAEVCERAESPRARSFTTSPARKRWARPSSNGGSPTAPPSDYGTAPFWELPDPLERLYGYIDFTATLARTGPCGCLLGIYSQELWQSQPEVRANCEAAFTAWADGLARLFDDAKACHAPTASFDPRSLAYHFIALFEGGLILARAYKRPEIVGDQLEHFKRYVETLFEAEFTGTKRREEARRAKV